MRGARVDSSDAPTAVPRWSRRGTPFRAVVAATAVVLILGGVACRRQSSGDAPAPAAPTPAPAAALVLPEGCSVDPAVLAVAAPYPIADCAVSGDRLGEKGPPITVAYAGRCMSFCSRACLTRFAERPEHYLRMVEAQQTARLMEGVQGLAERQTGRVIDPLSTPHAHGSFSNRTARGSAAAPPPAMPGLAP